MFSLLDAYKLVKRACIRNHATAVFKVLATASENGRQRSLVNSAANGDWLLKMITRFPFKTWYCKNFGNRSTELAILLNGNKFLGRS